jgi:transposase
MHRLLNIDDIAEGLNGMTATDEKMLFDYSALPGLRTTCPPEVNGLNILIRTEQSDSLGNCPKCGAVRGEGFKQNGTRPQYILDEPRGIRSVRIKVERQGHYCKKCKISPQQPLIGVDDKRRMTTRLLRYVQINSLLKPFSVVAQETALSARTVKEIFTDYTQMLDRSIRFKTPRVLGLDGVYIAGKECAILTDVEAGIVIDVWKEYRTEQLIDSLRRLPNCEKIEVVVIDMSRKLRKAVQKALPDAVIVIDRFHIQRNANRGIDQVRMRLGMGRRLQSKMCTRDLLRKHWNKLNDAEKEFLGKWFDLQPELRLGYDLKEAFFAIWFSSSTATAVARYQKWLERLTPKLEKDFGELLTAMKNWKEHIFNYFDHPYTNAFTEQSNRQIKDIKRETRGCGFETARAKSIYGTLIKREMDAARDQMRLKRRRKANRSQSGNGSESAPPLLVEAGGGQDSTQASLF